jgi:peptidyl-prolyl cis-trans isomerase SurA
MAAFRHPVLLRRLLLTTALLMAALTPLPTAAQQVAAMVNGEPITELDVTQRSRLLQLSREDASRQKALDQLINDKLKLQVAKRYRLEIPDADVEASFAAMGQRMRLNPQQFAQALSSGGISASALKARIKADIAWQQIIRGKFQASLQIREKDIAAHLERSKDDKDAVGYDYTLRPILLIVPRGSPEATVAARRREADGLRTRFQNCEEGLAFARGLRDVAVRDPILRSSADLSEDLRKLLNETPIGRLTPPDVTPQGVELFAVCDKRETTETPGKRQAREELFGQQFQARAERYLKELRRSAMIELR